MTSLQVLIKVFRPGKFLSTFVTFNYSSARVNILVSLKTRFIFKRFSTFFTFKLFCVLPNITKLHFFFFKFELFPTNFAIRRSTSYFMPVVWFYLFERFSTVFAVCYFDPLFFRFVKFLRKFLRKTYRLFLQIHSFLGLEHYCCRLDKIFH